MKRVTKIVSLAGFILVLALVVLAFALVRQPLGPALALEVPPEVQAAQPAAVQPAGLFQTGKTCGNTGVMRLLVHGRASSIEDGHYGADAVRLVWVDFDAPSASVLALPVEMWVDSPVLEKEGVLQSELNQVYQVAYQTAKGNPDAVRTQKATQALAQTIVDNFGFVPEHYVTVEQDAFIQYIDDIGGIDVSLTQAVTGELDYGSYNAGVNHLTGLRTLNLTRLMHPNGQVEPDIWGSLARQDAVLKGMQASALQVDNLDDLAKALRKVVTTDLSVDQVLDLACMLNEVNTPEMQTVGPDLVSYANGHMLPNVAGIKALIDSLGGPD